MALLKLVIKIVEDSQVQISAAVLVNAILAVLTFTDTITKDAAAIGYALLAAVGMFALAVLKAIDKGTFQSLTSR